MGRERFLSPRIFDCERVWAFVELSEVAEGQIRSCLFWHSNRLARLPIFTLKSLSWKPYRWLHQGSLAVEFQFSDPKIQECRQALSTHSHLGLLCSLSKGAEARGHRSSTRGTEYPPPSRKFWSLGKFLSQFYHFASILGKLCAPLWLLGMARELLPCDRFPTTDPYLVLQKPLSFRTRAHNIQSS